MAFCFSTAPLLSRSPGSFGDAALAAHEAAQWLRWTHRVLVRQGSWGKGAWVIGWLGHKS